MVKAIVCDIDGTITSRPPVRGFFEWDKVHLDVPKKVIIDIVNTYSFLGFAIVFVTGRDAVCRPATLEWLKKHTKVEPFTLLMRKHKDNREDSIVKEEIYNTLIKDNFDVQFVLDDRDSVVAMWRRIGLTCLQVDYGDF